MDKVGATYYYRRVVPENVRAYFKTATGKERVEFKISLGTKDRKQADRRVEIKDVEISAQFAEAERKLKAGIPPSQNPKADSEAYERRQQQHWEMQGLRDQDDAEQEAQHEIENDAFLAQLNRPNDELDVNQQAARRLLPQSLFDPPEEQAGRARQLKSKWDASAVEVTKAFNAGALGNNEADLNTYFVRYREVRNPQPASVERWRTAIKSLIAFLGHSDMRRIERTDIVRWRSALVAKGLASTTIRNGYLGGIKAIFSVAVDDGVIQINPVRVAAMKERQQQTRDKSLSDVEAKIILVGTLADQGTQIAPDHALARRWVPWVCAYTGARVNEITQLRECDIYQDGDVWVIKITPEAGRVKSGKARVVPLHAHLIEQGFHTLGVAGSERPLFYDPAKGRRGDKAVGAYAHYQKRGERLADWVRKLGVTDPHVRPNHGWRHLFKTKGHIAGIPDSALDWIMGHAPVNVAGTYGHWEIAALKREIDKIPCFQV